MSILEPQRLVPEHEYLAWEEGESARHEFVDGVIFAMAGGSQEHDDLVANLSLLIGPTARSHGCRWYAHARKVRIARAESLAAYYYPDVMVVCDDPPNRLYEDVPCLVVEVLSPGTSSRDRREKRIGYESISSVLVYLLVDQDTARVTVHRRTDAGWADEIAGEGAVIDLRCPPMKLAVDDIYRGVLL
jgi:Uma2 family endonuclease